MTKFKELLEELRRMEKDRKIKLRAVIILQANKTIIATKKELEDVQH